MLGVYAAARAEGINEIENALERAGAGLSTRIQDAISADVGYMTADARRARIAHVSMRRAGDWAHAARLETVANFSKRVQNTLSESPGHTGDEEWNLLAAVAMTGAVNELIAHWAESERPPETESIVNAIVFWFSNFLTSPHPGERSSAI